MGILLVTGLGMVSLSLSTVSSLCPEAATLTKGDWGKDVYRLIKPILLL